MIEKSEILYTIRWIFFIAAGTLLGDVLNQVIKDTGIKGNISLQVVSATFLIVISLILFDVD